MSVHLLPLAAICPSFREMITSTRGDLSIASVKWSPPNRNAEAG